MAFEVDFGTMVLGRGRSAGSSRCVCELEEVVDGAEHCPFVFDLVEASQEELSEAPGRLDLTEYWFDDLLSQAVATSRSEEHTSELQSRLHLVCRLLLEKKKE